MSGEILQLLASGVYLLVVMLLLLETFAARRAPTHSLAARWTSNAVLGFVNVVLHRLLVVVAGTAFAAFMESNSVGLFNVIAMPGWFGFAAGLLLLDLAKYLEHRVFHATPFLWRMHLVHHSDHDVDVTTHFRHHPFETVATFVVAMLVIAIAGIGPQEVLVYGLIYNFCSAAQHANIRLPGIVDASLRSVVVTPDMHRVHHSSYRPETDSNFGTILSCWDRLFGTYVAQPRDGHDGMQLGIGAFSGDREQWPDRVLLQPFKWRRPQAPGLHTPGAQPVELPEP